VHLHRSWDGGIGNRQDVHVQDASLGPEGAPMEPDPPWSPFTPEEVAELLEVVRTRWYVVAGWALDLFRGEVTREHEDIEIGVPLEGFAEVRAALGAYQCEVVGSTEEGGPRRWPLASPAFEEHFQTWFRDPATGAYRLDVFRDPHEGDTWVCRRDPTITLPYREAIRTSSAGIPYLAPHLALLFKAKRARPKDHADLRGALPLLSPAEVAWLAGSLEQIHPGHVWLAEL
jgi:hypothetical protein